MPNTQNEKRLTYGLLLSSIEESCQSEIGSGIQSYAEQYNIDIIVYLSTFQQKTGAVKEHYNVIFDAINATDSIDGLIVLTGSIVEDIGNEQILNFMKNYTKTPIISLSMEVEGIPSILVNNRDGIEQVTDHIIEMHNKKSLAFIKGPEGHGEAEARLEGFKRSLNKHNIEINDELILQGHFSEDDGIEATKELISKGIFFDAIITADDDTAMGVIKELANQKIMVPSEVVVGGFDDIDNASIITPSITTVHQPFFELGVEGIKDLGKMVAGEELPSVKFVEPHLKIRQSCGCVSIGDTVDIEKISKDYSAKDKKEIVLILENLFDKNVDKKDIHYKLENLVSFVSGTTFNPQQFLEKFDSILIHYRENSHDIYIWRSVLLHLLVWVEHNESIESQKLRDITHAIYRATSLVESTALREKEQNRVDEEWTQWQVRGISQDIVTSFDNKSLFDKLAVARDELEINTIMVFGYSNPIKYKKWEIPEDTRLLIGLDGKRDIYESNLNAQYILFKDITNQNKFHLENRRKTLFFMPLFFGEHQNGVLLLEYIPDLPIDTYESIRISISTALKGASLIEDIKNISITDELTGIYNRRGFMTLSASRLAQFRRSAMPVVGSVFFIDLDGLKPINDNLGHQFGDDAIRETAKILKASTREEDIIGRMGGDEFTIFTSQLDPKNTKEIIKRIRQKFKEFNEVNDRPYVLNCSIGAVTIKDYTESGFEKVLAQADALLYKEKQEKKARGIGRL